MHGISPSQLVTMIETASAGWLLFVPLISGGALVAAMSFYLLLTIASSYLRGWRSSLNSLPGPRPTSLLLGNFGVVNEQESARMMEKWISEYGRAYVVQSLLGVRFMLHTCVT